MEADRWLHRLVPLGGLVVFLTSFLAIANPAVAEEEQQSTSAEITYSKDVAPILRRSCQHCHRAGQMAPFSMMSYNETRPWARAIKTKVMNREMPPWHIDKTIGIQKFKDDYSLSDREIQTIARWVDSGAPQGDPKDLPAPRIFSDDDRWTIGTPDLIVKSTPITIPPAGPDTFPNIVVDPGITEDRYIKAVETKPSPKAKKVVHHLLVYSVGDTQEDGTVEETFLNEYAQGKNGDVYPEGTGKLLKAGTKFRFSNHLHPVGEEITDEAQIAFVFYPKGYVPPRVIYAEPMGGANGARAGVDLDIPAGQIVRHDGYTHLAQAVKLTSFQPHLHTRGIRQCLELIYPDNQQEVLSCSNFSFNWHIVYNYADDVAPIAPAGSFVHVISWHDNTNWKGNPDPNNWVGYGDRTIDDMSTSWVGFYHLTPEEYKAELAARAARRAQQTQTTQQQQR
jgi:hypothetical protein